MTLPYKRHLVKDAAAQGGYKRLPSGAVLHCVCMNPDRNHPQGFKNIKEAK